MPGIKTAHTVLLGVAVTSTPAMAAQQQFVPHDAGLQLQGFICDLPDWGLDQSYDATVTYMTGGRHGHGFLNLALHNLGDMGNLSPGGAANDKIVVGATINGARNQFFKTLAYTTDTCAPILKVDLIYTTPDNSTARFAQVECERVLSKVLNTDGTTTTTVTPRDLGIPKNAIIQTLGFSPGPQFANQAIQISDVSLNRQFVGFNTNTINNCAFAPFDQPFS